MGEKAIDDALQCNRVRSTVMFQAHLPLPFTSLVRLPLESTLSGPEVSAAPSFGKYNQAGNRRYSCLWTRIRPFCLLGPAVPVERPTVPVLSWLDSRLLGS